jgi:hypothetical protein
MLKLARVPRKLGLMPQAANSFLKYFHFRTNLLIILTPCIVYDSQMYLLANCLSSCDVTNCVPKHLITRDALCDVGYLSLKILRLQRAAQRITFVCVIFNISDSTYNTGVVINFHNCMMYDIERLKG